MLIRHDGSTRLTTAILLLCFCLMGIASSNAFAQTQPNFPNLTGRVIDQADLLSVSEEQVLSTQLSEHEAQTSNQIVVVTVNSLDGYADAEYAQKLGTQWGIGTAEKNNGVVLLVTPNERKVRIEVGYGLEGALPDALAGQIIRRDILPKFKEDDYSGGIKSGVNSILQAVVGEYNYEPPSSTGGKSFDFIPLVFIAIIAIPALLRKRGLYRIANAAFPASFFGLVATVLSANILLGLAVGAVIFIATYLFSPNAGNGHSGGRAGRDGSRGHRRSRRSGDGFSGGGGSFGGGGASGSW